MRWTLDDLTIEVVTGDIASQPDMDAVVNAANAELRAGGGVAGAIHRRAGPALEAECRPFAPIRPGEAVITSAHRLPNRYVIHCLGPVYGLDAAAAPLLVSCYVESLTLAEERGIASIAFPAISTGAFGYPMEEAARIAAEAVVAASSRLFRVRHIRFVMWNERDQFIHAGAFRRAIEQLAVRRAARGQ